MTLQQLYENLHGNYAEAKTRLMMDRLVEKFVLKFPGDPTMQELRDAVAAGDNATAFRAVHTLKGVAANLALTDLRSAASDLTEQMRNLDKPADTTLMERVESTYQCCIDAIAAYVAEKE